MKKLVAVQFVGRLELVVDTVPQDEAEYVNDTVLSLQTLLNEKTNGAVTLRPSSFQLYPHDTVPVPVEDTDTKESC